MKMAYVIVKKLMLRNLAVYMLFTIFSLVIGAIIVYESGVYELIIGLSFWSAGIIMIILAWLYFDFYEEEKLKVVRR